MRTSALTFVVLLAAATAAVGVGGVSGCAKRPSGNATVTAKAAGTATPAKAPPPRTPPPRTTEELETQERRPRLRETALYVDGVQKGILRAQELAPSVVARHETITGGVKVTRFYFSDVAKSLGLDLAKVKAAHFHGGGRISMVDHAELARIGSELAFSFTMEDRGKPQMQWPSKKLHVSTLIDMLSAVTFYVDKEPPHLLADGMTLVMPDGTEVGENLPYTNPEQGTGTRVYVDGALVDTVKRKRLTNDLLAGGGLGGGETSKFSLASYAKKLGIEPAKAKAVDVLAGDDVIARLPAAKAAEVTFGVPRHNRGHAMLDLPSRDGEGGRREARVSAIQFYVKATPPSRKLTAIDDAPEAQSVSGGRAENGGGSGGDE
jgi:hypothetical protein